MVLEIALWVAQIILAGMFAFAGYTKTTRPIPELAKMMKWVNDSPLSLVRFIGIVELAGALGMILPMLTHILPWLTPLAAIGFLIIQILAIGVHARRSEVGETLVLNIVLIALSAFVIWGRWSLFGA